MLYVHTRQSGKSMFIETLLHDRFAARSGEMSGFDLQRFRYICCRIKCLHETMYC